MRKPAIISLSLLAAIAAGVVLLPAFEATANHGESAQGSRPISENRALDARGRLSVRNTSGDVVVEVWEHEQMALTGSLGDSVERLEITGTSSDLKVEVKLRKGNHHSNADTHLVLKVPADIALLLEGTSADLTVNGLRGNLNARTVSGDVQLDVASRELSAQTVSGDLHIQAPQAVQTQLVTVSGDTEVAGASGVLSAESVSGDINLQGGMFSKLMLKSVSGDVEAKAATAAGAQVRAESLSGDVHFNVAGNLNAQVSLKTFSGDSHCELDNVQPVADGRRTLYKVGDGKGQVSLTSFSGDVVLNEARYR